MKTNITTLGPLVLPLSEQLFFFGNLVWRHLFGNKNAKTNNSQQANNIKPYIPDYKLAFEHFCVYAASKTVLDELQRNLELSEENMEASRSTLHRFGINIELRDHLTYIHNMLSYVVRVNVVLIIYYYV